jgi:hypothetical protein
MKTKHVSSLLILIAFAFFGCQYKDVFKTFNYSDKWEISYPSYFNKTTYVYPGAEFQVKNSYRDTYMFTRGFDADTTAVVVLDSFTTLLRSNLVDPRVEKDTTFELNGSQFTAQYITGILEDKRMFYIIAVIQAENEFYHFGSWMFNNKRELWQADFEKALYSWKKLNKK